MRTELSEYRWIGRELTREGCGRGREGEEPHELHHKTFIQVGYGHASCWRCVCVRSNIEGRGPTHGRIGIAAGFGITTSGGVAARSGPGCSGTACGTTARGTTARE